MSVRSLVLPLLRAAAWFDGEPPEVLRSGTDGWLDLAWGAPDLTFLEPMQRRRLSPLGRAFCHCAHRISPPSDVRVVFASRHGEVERTLAVLQDLAAQAEVSPTMFSMSVHNAVPGLWSILRGNRAAVCALAAGPETFGWGLVEALATYQAYAPDPVLFVYADERLPDPWADPTPRGLLHSLALLLGEPAQKRLEQCWEPAPERREPEQPQSLQALQALTGPDPAAWRGFASAWRWACI